MPTETTTTGTKNTIDALRETAAAHPESFQQALSLIRWLTAAQDGSNETPQQSLNEIEDLAADALRR